MYLRFLQLTLGTVCHFAPSAWTDRASDILVFLFEFPESRNFSVPFFTYGPHAMKVCRYLGWEMSVRVPVARSKMCEGLLPWPLEPVCLGKKVLDL